MIMNSPIYMINRENGKVHRAEWVNEYGKMNLNSQVMRCLNDGQYTVRFHCMESVSNFP